MSADCATLLPLIEGSGQEHILSRWATMLPAQRDVLQQQLREMSPPLAHLQHVLRDSLALLQGGSNSHTTVEPPPSSSVLDLTTLSSEEVQRLREIGLKEICAGRTAVLLLAGGSGSRLGVSVPKGLFTCEELPGSPSLFQMHSEKILRMEQLAGLECGPNPGRIHVLIMTSEHNDAATRAYFLQHAYFGLQPAQVSFFTQTSLPCYSAESGKILLTSSGTMCVAPGGNGGVYGSLARRREDGGSMLDHLHAMGVRHVQFLNVDNLLAKMADPVFLGYAVDGRLPIAVKTTPKARADERVGVFAIVNGAVGVVEYTEIGQERATERDATTGALRYNCANISNYTLSVEFLELAAKKMESLTHYHAAQKNITDADPPCMGIKLEAFNFDVFGCATELCAPSTPYFGILQVRREEEFGPIKNADAPGAVDCPKTAANLLLELHRTWVLAHLRARIAVDQCENSIYANERVKRFSAAVEVLQQGQRLVFVSPLISAEGEGLEHYDAVLVDGLLAAEGPAIMALFPNNNNNNSASKI